MAKILQFNKERWECALALSSCKIHVSTHAKICLQGIDDSGKTFSKTLDIFEIGRLYDMLIDRFYRKSNDCNEKVQIKK